MPGSEDFPLLLLGKFQWVWEVGEGRDYHKVPSDNFFLVSLLQVNCSGHLGGGSFASSILFPPKEAPLSFGLGVE